MKRSFTGGVLAAALAATMIAPPAHADYYSIKDPADAEGSLNDILGMRVRHGEARVNVALNLLDLQRDTSAGVSVYFDTVKSSPGPEYVLSSGLGDGTDYTLTEARRWRAHGEPVDCDYEVRIKWGRERFRSLVSRDCFNTPDEIRASVKMGDVPDESLRVIDWAPERRRWSLWLRPGDTAA